MNFEIGQGRHKGAARRPSRRRWGIAASIAVSAVAATSLVGMATAQARTPTQTMQGRAFNVSVETATLGKSTPIVGPIADTGVITTTTAESVTPPCSVLTGLVAAQALCNQVTTSTDPNAVSAATTLASIQIGVTGLPAIVLRAVSVSSVTTCAGSVGTTTIGFLSVGTHVVINTPTLIKPNTQLVVAGIKLALNQQVPAVAPLTGLRVNALHISLGNAVSSIYVTVGHADTVIRKCPAD